MDHQRIPADRPVRIVVIGAGNRAHKYLEYARRHPERLQPVAIVETNDLRRNELADRFGVAESGRYNDYNDFFSRPVAADAVLIATPENIHFDPCMKAVEAGYHILLEKPIAQNYDECRAIARQARKRGVLVGICHVLRYHPYFVKIKQIIDSGELGEIISINHVSAVGIDRATHGYVRGLWRRAEATNPMLLAKCCHDVDFLLWITGSPCRKISSFGSLRWFRTAHAPQGSTERCIDCPVESNCPYSAVDLYCNRRDWISNFDVPHGKSLDEVLMEELKQGPYGRCVYRCDNNDGYDNPQHRVAAALVLDGSGLLAFRRSGLGLSLAARLFIGDSGVLRVGCGRNDRLCVFLALPGKTDALVAPVAHIFL